MNEQIGPPEEAKIEKFDWGKLVNVSEVSLNVSQEVIVTTADKVRICLSEHLKRMERKRGWIAPLGMFVMIILTFTTSTFKDVGLDADFWRAVFSIFGVLSFAWLLWSIIEAWQSRGIEDIVADLKKGSQGLTGHRSNH